MPDFNLEDILPLLMSRQKQQQAEQASGAAANLAGKTLAPNLYDYLANKAPTPTPPIPNQAGKIPPQDPMDPRIVPALRDVGMLGAGGALGRVAAPLAGEVAGLAGRVAAPSLDSSGALRAVGGAAMQAPDQAQAAKLSYEQRQQLELQRRQAEQATAAETARTQSQTQAQIESDKAKAEAQRQLESQRQTDIVAALKKERETPFREKYQHAAEMMPVAGMLASAAIPYAKGLASKIPLGRFTSDWEKAGNVAEQALKGRNKGPATLAVNKLSDYEAKWPEMEKRYTPGPGQTALTSVIPAEMTAFPTEYDAMTQNPNSPSKPTLDDIISTAGRAGLAGAVGTGAAKLGAGLVPKTRPYVGGQGIINAYNQRFPPTKAQQKLIADQLRLSGPR